MKKLWSADGETCKIIYEKGGSFYYCVAYRNRSRSSGEEYITVCVSSQIGCNQSCLFCATGDHKYICSLTANEICREITDGVLSFEDTVRERDISTVHVIFEGMGEASHNFGACAEGFHGAYEALLSRLSKVVLRFSTVGTAGFDKVLFDHYSLCKNKYPNTSFQIKLSLHAPNNSLRRKLLADPSLPDVEETLCAFERVADLCGHPLVCNYVLMENEDLSLCNYTDECLFETAELLKGRNVMLLLGTYSETDRGFTGPDHSVFERWEKTVREAGIETFVTQLKGADIHAACGMLHYEGEKK